ncbi:hypothetical protein Leryth_010004, partial [Lithospermum erythrorhizon]
MQLPFPSTRVPSPSYYPGAVYSTCLPTMSPSTILS